MIMTLETTPATADLDRRETLLRDLVRSAGEVALRGFVDRRAADIVLKGPQDFLTEADAAVERHVRARLAEVFPEDGFLGEETGSAGSGPHLWVVDPIDGTANFARRIPHFCVSIALVAGNRTQLGAIYNPVLDELYLARRGQGAEKDGKRIRVADTSDPRAACVELGWSTRVPRSQYLGALERMLDMGVNIRRNASGALGLAYVADGRSDGYVELHMHPWDALAGLLLVEEAGGVVAPFIERGAIERGGAVLASAPALAKAISAAAGIELAPGYALQSAS
jgi:myo-inositol-1(or 4)-monophosphatase